MVVAAALVFFLTRGPREDDVDVPDHSGRI
jgi:hypothetical protein